LALDVFLKTGHKLPVKALFSKRMKWQTILPF